MAIFLTSDTHFNHDKEFIWKARGFKCVKDMNEAIVRGINNVVMPDDDLYILGDLCFGDVDSGKKYLDKLNGNLHIVWGNHDSARKRVMYDTVTSIVETANSLYLDYNGYHFYLSHYPSLTENGPRKPLEKELINLHGHTHQTSYFTPGQSLMFHVGLDSFIPQMEPISIEKILALMDKNDHIN